MLENKRKVTFSAWLLRRAKHSGSGPTLKIMASELVSEWQATQESQLGLYLRECGIKYAKPRVVRAKGPAIEPFYDWFMRQPESAAVALARSHITHVWLRRGAVASHAIYRDLRYMQVSDDDIEAIRGLWVSYAAAKRLPTESERAKHRRAMARRLERFRKVEPTAVKLPSPFDPA